MHAIQAHYRDDAIRQQRTAMGISPDAPTDVELECLAQTWSEHCKHKIFASKIHHVDHETGEDTVVDSLFKTHIMKPTHDMQEDVDWLLSVFHDNSGVIAWDDTWSVCMKAETHNSPSALDPYGGAMTGIVGVNRDILGTGLGARPIANTDVFCFGPPDWEGNLPENLFHPSRVLRGVHAGVRVGGNESGIPTVNGAIVFDDRYIGKPLVYCGTVGIMPRVLNDGRPSHVKTPVAGDIVYMVGGRVGLRRHPRRDLLLAGADRRITVERRSDRRPHHAEEDARHGAGSTGCRPHRQHHRQRRRRIVVLDWRNGRADQRL